MNAQSTGYSPSVFESFNARSLAPEQVAKTFVPSPAFAELAGRSHATVIGPRGSGKTSLLKMLQPRALDSWRTQEGETFRGMIDYTSVFIPTDISWNRQTSAILEGLPANLCRLFRAAAFTTHVLHELVETFCWRVDSAGDNPAGRFRGVNISLSDQRSIARQLAQTWELTPVTETLVGIKHALTARHAQIWSLAQRAALVNSESSSLPNWLSHDLISQCSFAIELFDDSVGQPQGRWALLFDELELAPDWIMSGLLTALRSTNPKIIYKLAISPFNETYQSLSNAIQAVPGQDYTEIRLWYAQKEEGLEFSRSLMESVCRESNVVLRDLTELLGRSFLEIPDGGPKAYDRQSQQYKILKRALENDSSFRAFWDRQGVDVNRIGDMSEPERAAKVRKIYPLAAIREYFRSVEGSAGAAQQPTRGRKSLEIYAGSLGILTVTEGNPRWIIGLTKALVRKLGDLGKAPIPRAAQAQLIDSTLHKFRARLKTISVHPTITRRRNNSLLGFLDIIGEFFKEGVLLADFRAQPPLSFTVDSTASQELVTAIGRALNAGALVYIPDKDSLGVLNDVRGKRFRLSYLLAPTYSLPLKLGDSISLSRILLQHTKNVPVMLDQGQLELEGDCS